MHEAIETLGARFSKVKILKGVSRYFSNPWRLSLLNLLLMLAAFAGNSYFQVFCNPVPWAAFLLVLCALFLIFYPHIINYKKLEIPFAALAGLTFSVCLYCIFFMEGMNLAGLALMLFGIGFLTYIPHFLAIQMLYNFVFHTKNRWIAWVFAGTITISFVLLFVAGYQYRQALNRFEGFGREGFELREKGYFTERILGMHFIYHTRLCIYDGWRPPLHDPWLVMGMRMNGMKDPISADLQQRVSLYRRYFPERKVKYDCSCAWQYRQNYHNDHLFDE